MALKEHMRSFVINLPGADDRLAAFRAKEAEVGLESEVFPAVNGAELPSFPAHRKHLTPGEIGVLLSHRTLLRDRAAGSGTEWILIMEDDVHFWDDFPDLLARTVSDADRMGKRMVQLGWVPLTRKPRWASLVRDRLVASRAVRVAARIVRPHVTMEPPWVVDAPFGWGAHCYMVRADFAGALADLLDGPRIHAPLDHYYRLLRLLYPDEVGRARFSLAGQTPGHGSTTVADRQERAFQTDSRGRVLRSI